MKACNIVVSQLQSPLQVGADESLGSSKLCFSNSQRRERGFIELSFVTNHGLVALSADVSEHSSYRGREVGSIFDGASHYLTHLFFGGISVNFHRLSEYHFFDRQHKYALCAKVLKL